MPSFHARLAPAGDRVVAWDRNGQDAFWVFEVGSAKPIVRGRLEDAFWPVVSPSFEHVALAPQERTRTAQSFRLYRPPAEYPARWPFHVPNDKGNAALSAGGRLIAIQRDNQRLEVLRTSNGETVAFCDGAWHRASYLEFHPTEPRLFAVAFGGAMQCWDLSSVAEAAPPPPAGEGPAPGAG